jgi:hypothetical protein
VSRGSHSVVMTESLDELLREHLLRTDRQEDLCFALWNPSRGSSRISAVLERAILPSDGDRRVHGNASFEPNFLERALSEASTAGMGLAFLHSHPLGRGWQGMSRPDVEAEKGMCAAVFGATELPLIGLTLAEDGEWSARFWERTAPHKYSRKWAYSVRVAGNGFAATYCDEISPRPIGTAEQVRTISSWGEESQEKLARLHIGVVGAGSVGGFVAESLARTGVEDVTVIDFDRIKPHNLDRLLYATRAHVGELKSQTLIDHIEKSATASGFRASAIEAAVYEERGFRAALDCDILISCVDRPWGRHVLNTIAYSHLIPVVDGGIFVRRNRSGKLTAADWRSHTATVGRACLQCLGQYDVAFVQLEREGYLDDPTYIERLPPDHPVKTRENVFIFSMCCAGQMMQQLLALVIAPLEEPNLGAQLYHFVGGFMELPKFPACDPNCFLHQLIAKGDLSGLHVTGERPPIRVSSHAPSEAPGR